MSCHPQMDTSNTSTHLLPPSRPTLPTRFRAALTAFRSPIHAPLSPQLSPPPTPTAVALPPYPPTLSLAELHLVLSRRLANLHLPDNPHLLFSEAFSATLTYICALFSKIRLLQTKPVTQLRTNDYCTFHTLRLISLSQLNPLRLLFRPLFRIFPPFHWLLAPFHQMSIPFLLDLLLHHFKSRLTAHLIPAPLSDLHSLRQHIATTLSTTAHNFSDHLSKKGAQLRHDLELKEPPPLHINPFPFFAREEDDLKTPINRRSEVGKVRTPGRFRALRASPTRRGLSALYEAESPLLSLLPRSIARVTDTPPTQGVPPSATPGANSGAPRSSRMS